jgi:hypothetical protein
MRDKYIAQLESRLERLVEGVFTRFFGRSVRSQDIALHIARAMEDGLHTPNGTDPRPVAPDLYQIHLDPQTAENLLSHNPTLTTVLSGYLVELATNAGYRLDRDPVISVLGDEALAGERIQVSAQHTGTDAYSTSVMRRVQLSTPVEPPKNPQLIIGNRVVALVENMINIGRNLDNDIVLEDIHASRHHAQLRLRFGTYTIFDAESRSGTFVNDIRITEKGLKPGDVIRMGETRIVYMEDSADEESATSPFLPVE